MDYSSFSCDELVRACATSKDPEAWEQFVCRFEKTIRVAVWRVTKRYGQNDSALVQDLVQDTFAKICGDNNRFLRDGMAVLSGIEYALPIRTEYKGRFVSPT